MPIIKTNVSWGLDFWDMHDDMQYQAEFLVRKKDDGSTYPYVINTSVVADSGELFRKRNGSWHVTKPTIEMKLIIFSDEKSKQDYLDSINRTEKSRYDKQ